MLCVCVCVCVKKMTIHEGKKMSPNTDFVGKTVSFCLYSV